MLDQPRGYTAGYWSEAGKALLANMLKSLRAQELTEYDELPPHGVHDVLEDLKKRCDGDIDDPLYLHAAMLVHVSERIHWNTNLFNYSNALSNVLSHDTSSRTYVSMFNYFCDRHVQTMNS